MSSPYDINRLERAVVAAVAPRKMVEIEGWLVPLDDGEILRAKSAVPLSHKAEAEAINLIEPLYWTEGLTPTFRLAEAPGLSGIRRDLTRRGYEGFTPTVTKIGDVERLATLRDVPGEIMAAPDDGWRAVFASEGDPDVRARRLANLLRSPDILYGAVREDGEVVAIGAVAFGHGWAGINAMQTLARHRGRGYATQVLTALGQAIAKRGVTQVYLQVEETNDARSLYRKAGFEKAWDYRHWRRPT